MQAPAWIDELYPYAFRLAGARHRSARESRGTGSTAPEAGCIRYIFVVIPLDVVYNLKSRNLQGATTELSASRVR